MNNQGMMVPKFGGDGAGEVNFNGNRQIKGNAAIGTTPGTSTVAEFLEAVFYPFVNALISLNSGTSYFEKGTSQNIALTGVVTANDEDTFTNARIEASDGGNIALTAQAGSYSVIDNSVETDVNYIAKIDVGGNGNPTTIESAVKHIRFIYAAYYGKNSTGAVPTADDIIAGTKVIVLTNSNFTVNPNTDGSEYGWFAVPHAQTGKLYTAWYITALNNSSIGAGQFIENKGSINLNGVVYDIYMYGFASAVNANLKLS